jgi:hypothetical protein
VPVYMRSLGVDAALRQAEILSNVREARLSYESLLAEDGEPTIDERVHPLAIVLSQGCDLSWDFTARTAPDAAEQERLAHKMIPNILFCELWHATDLRGQQRLNNALWSRIAINGDERYHVLPSCPPELDAAATGLPELAIDFKRVFTVASEELYYRLRRDVQRRCVLTVPFVQDLSNRFGYFLARVALPDEEHAPQPLSGQAEMIP